MKRLNRQINNKLRLLNESLYDTPLYSFRSWYYKNSLEPLGFTRKLWNSEYAIWRLWV